MPIHDIVREERIAQGLSISELARLAEVDDGNLSRFERGQQWMREVTLLRVLGVLGLKLVKASEQGASEDTATAAVSSTCDESPTTP